MSTSFKDFVGEVQHRIEAGEQAEAVRTTRAVLTTLGERVSEGGATDIASPLPKEIDRYLLAADHGQVYDYDTFIQRVTDRLNYDDLELDSGHGQPSNIDQGEAVYRTKAVVALVSDLVRGGELAHVEEQLPPEFDDLFEFSKTDSPPWGDD
ncbi:DUF2267 family protein [Natronomonas pharaonis DSM 2160]|uniref:DUF2267 family protein n=1 Tax=Natronomonas pharaonis (strain ATCC 35678 / DSM 2160 / CIP 103997 / JCM 8858 / NBRC 14720 / NCIMB 2260 / Gabara) TaxID=348780 RepID=A0A1U7ETH0_NATPD|nr:DUF2267 domain-containing protein [Natronomonas pharaonis]CAI48198.1 DUF2267 family protein [Natronomonas pharaonis DSM 2160]